MQKALNEGLVYVATEEERFLEEAFISAVTARQAGVDLPILLYTDRPTHPLCSKKLFDSIILAPPSISGITRWASGQLRRIQCLSRSPFDRTLYLDTDTRFRRNKLVELFSKLDEFDLCMAEANTDDSFSRYHFGAPLFNVGVILYRSGPRLGSFFDDWIRLCERNFKFVRQRELPEISSIEHVASQELRRRLLCIDQIALAEILTPVQNNTGLRVQSLKYCWNYRGSVSRENNCEEPVIEHLPRPAGALHESEFHRALLLWEGRQS